MILKDKNTRDHTARGARESHARGVYPTQDTSRIETVRVKQEEETETRIMKEIKIFGRKEHGHEGEKSPNKT